jgi:hypothetical protein
VPAVLRLGELLEQYNHIDQAIGLLLDTIRTVEAARFHLPMYSQLARLLENSGRLAEAAQVRARMQNQLTPGAAPAAAAPSAPAAPIAATPAPTAIAAAPAPTVGPATAGATPRDPFASLVDPFGNKGGQAAAAQPDAYTFLKDIPIFAELRGEDMRDLYRACEEVNYGSGETIVEQGVPGRGLSVIVQGDVQVRRVDVTGDTVLARLQPGSYFGELSLLDSSPTSARVVAVGPVFCLFISAERFEQFIMSHDEAARRIYRLFARTLAERLRTANLRK